jgi:hypothetical protein
MGSVLGDSGNGVFVQMKNAAALSNSNDDEGSPRKRSLSSGEAAYKRSNPLPVKPEKRNKWHKTASFRTVVLNTQKTPPILRRAGRNF